LRRNLGLVEAVGMSVSIIAPTMAMAFTTTLTVQSSVLLLWPLWNSVYPVQSWPSNLWPYFVVSWLVAGTVLAFLRPAAELVPAAAD
jgi:hypothetical protein